MKTGNNIKEPIYGRLVELLLLKTHSDVYDTLYHNNMSKSESTIDTVNQLMRNIVATKTVNQICTPVANTIINNLNIN